jgi:hypothetical protein
MIGMSSRFITGELHRIYAIYCDAGPCLIQIERNRWQKNDSSNGEYVCCDSRTLLFTLTRSHCLSVNKE